MKKIFFSFLIGFFLFTPSTIAQKIVVKHKNITVKVRPNQPNIIIVKTNKLKRNYNIDSRALEMEFKEREICLD